MSFVRRCAGLAAVACGAGMALVGCAQARADGQGDGDGSGGAAVALPDLGEPVVCADAPAETVGRWALYPYPEGFSDLDRPMAASDGEFLAIAARGCMECGLAVLETDGGTWSTQRVTWPSEFDWEGFLRWEGHSVASVLGPDGTGGEVAGLGVIAPGEVVATFALPAPFDVAWTAPRSTSAGLVFWGRRENLGGSYALKPGDPGRQYFTGGIFHPDTLSWTEIPEARPTADVIIDANYNIGGSTALTWADGKLVVWGTNPERTDTWGSVFDVEKGTWAELPRGSGSPIALAGSSVLAAGSDLFVFGGIALSDSNTQWPPHYNYRMWRYSMESEAWAELDVPSWVHAQTGVAVDDRLFFMGACGGGGMLYDPKADTWQRVTDDGAPPSPGQFHPLGSLLAITGASYDPVEVLGAFVLKLD